MSNLNRLWNCKNGYQGDTKKVLCVCSSGLLRSPTAAVILSQPPYNYNTRAVGVDKSHALIPIDQVLLEWADEIICMDSDHEKEIRHLTDKPIVVLGIPDEFGYMDGALVDQIKINYDSILRAREDRKNITQAKSSKKVKK